MRKRQRGKEVLGVKCAVLDVKGEVCGPKGELFGVRCWVSGVKCSVVCVEWYSDQKLSRFQISGFWGFDLWPDSARGASQGYLVHKNLPAPGTTAGP